MSRLRSASSRQSRVLMVGGGSAGHVAPMVAVAEALRELDPDVRITFVCSDRPSDGAFLAMENETYTTLPLPRRSLALPLQLLRGFFEGRRILTDVRPDVVFSKGGAVSVPMCLAAFLKRIPIVVHESDAVMGSANRIVSFFAQKICLGWAGIREQVASTTDESATSYPLPTTSYPLPATHYPLPATSYPLPTTRFVVTGNPIRSRILQGSREQGLRITGLSGDRPILLVMGGSQGALTINQTVAKHLDELLQIVDVIHLTGAGKSVASERPGYYATEFGSDVLPHLYACADLALSRAGASSIAELEALGVAAILVPLEGLAGNHQVKNAERASARGALHVPQDRLDAELVSLVRSAVASVTERRGRRYATQPEAARLIAETVLQSVAQEKADA